jgi:L-ascorbate metabolism protein UlaG (beta-lactamase superfamily)
MIERPRSDHFDGRRFFNPHGNTDRGFRDLWRWRRTRTPVPWPESLPLQPYPPPPDVIDPARVAVTMIGHATFLVRTSDAVWLTDPVFTTHAGPFGRLGPRRVREPGLSLDSLPALDFILVSHSHYDHLQLASLHACALRGTPTIVAPLGLGAYLAGRGFSRIVELDWWDEAAVGEARVTCVPAQHFSARTPWDRNLTLWCGFVVRTPQAAVYFAADSGYSPQFLEIGRRCSPIDVGLIPIGAYEPRWFMKPMHMNPEEAVQVHRDVGARHSVAMHFGVFHLTDEGIDDPIRGLERAREAAGVRPEQFRVIDFGETVVL